MKRLTMDLCELTDDFKIKISDTIGYRVYSLKKRLSTKVGGIVILMYLFLSMGIALLIEWVLKHI